MIKVSSLFALLLVVVACSSTKQEPTTTGGDTITSPGSSSETLLNQLTEEQKAEGWKLLFDGTSMNGWRTFRNQENDSWEVVDGTLHCKPFKENAENKRADIVTVDQYENFELVFDWRISPHGNSGVMFRVTEEHEQPYATGPEFQLIDDEGYPGDLQPGQLTGANYDMHVPTQNASKPVGEWNTSRLVVRKNNVEHWINGMKVVEYELYTDDWKERKARSKWKDFPAYATESKGHIDLQDHGNEVWFRNIRLKSF